ncbi:MAG: response regulator transcription factor [Propionibacteriaceae bacterium]|nr:response regulator transcription factor [Propionibacteriaceae bacterium]
MVKVLIADDQALVLEGMAALLALEHDIEVVAKVTRSEEVVPAARAAGVEVCLLDIQMPGMDGIETAARVRDELPGVRVIIVTTFDRPGYLRRALDAGVIGFVVKTTPARVLAEAVRRAQQGLRTVDPALANELLFSGPNPLTPREQEVLRLARFGDPIARLAAQLHLSQGTVRNHLSSAIGKTGATNRVEAARIATERGWL